MDSEGPPPPRRSWLGALLVVLLIGGSAIGVLIYQLRQGGEKPKIDASGFDISQVKDTRTTSVSQSSTQQTQSSLVMVKTGLPGIQFGTKPGSSPSAGQTDNSAQSAQKAAENFTQMCRDNEVKVRAFTEAWTRKSLVIQQFGKDWMAYPDLKKLNDDYMRDHDPVAFTRGLTHSDNFAKLITKYARQPDIQQFAQQGAKQVPTELFNAGLDYVNRENTVKTLANKVIESLGFPPGILGSGVGAPQIDANKIMGSILQGNPQMQKALESTPELQKQMQNATQQGNPH